MDESSSITSHPPTPTQRKAKNDCWLVAGRAAERHSFFFKRGNQNTI